MNFNKIALPFIFLAILFSGAECQVMKVDARGLELYQQGSLLISSGDYIKADSLLTLALCSYKNENVYFNRALSRLYRKDTCGFCHDIQIAANRYHDSEARRLFNEKCCFKVDTFYYDEKFRSVNDTSYKYLEEVQYIKPNGKRMGDIHDISAQGRKIAMEWNCDQVLSGINDNPTNIIASYVLIDTVKFYHQASRMYTFKDRTDYAETRNKAVQYFGVRYKDLKQKSSSGMVQLVFELWVSFEGKAVNGELIEVYPGLVSDELLPQLKKDIVDLALNYPKMVPANFKGKPVNFIGYELIEF